MRTPHAHLDRRCDGEVYGVLKLGFTKDASRFEYCFIGEKQGELTFDGAIIGEHPKFKGIDAFESWCNRYAAEH